MTRIVNWAFKVFKIVTLKYQSLGLSQRVLRIEKSLIFEVRVGIERKKNQFELHLKWRVITQFCSPSSNFPDW